MLLGCKNTNCSNSENKNQQEKGNLPFAVADLVSSRSLHV